MTADAGTATVLALSTAEWLLAFGAAAAAVFAVVTTASRGRAIRRLETAARRLDPTSPAPARRGIAPQVARVERAVEAAVDQAAVDAETGRRLATAIDAIPQGVVICDVSGEVVFRNAVGEQLTRTRHGEALVGAAVDELLEAARGGRPSQDTLELFGPPRRVVAISTFPLAGGAAPAERARVGALAVIEDITERRRLEHVRRDFVANISHELKTPVGALALLAETIVAEEDAEVRTRLAERMLTESDRVSRTIDDLLSLSQIEAEEGPHREPVPVAQVVEEAVARQQPAAEQRGVAVTTRVAEPEAVVHGDRRQLVSALFNLLENAVKFSDRGSTVEVEARGSDGYVELAVVDHGIGIPAHDLERVFERFYRVDRARSRETGGTGLGLAIVRHVMVNHGGEARVSSVEGEGATFTLRLPARTDGPAPGARGPGARLGAAAPTAGGRDQPDPTAGPTDGPLGAPDVLEAR